MVTERVTVLLRPLLHSHPLGSLLRAAQAILPLVSIRLLALESAGDPRFEGGIPEHVQGRSLGWLHVTEVRPLTHLVDCRRNLLTYACMGWLRGANRSQASMKRLDDDTRTMQDIVGHETLRGALARFCRSCLCEELALFVIRMHTYAVR